MTKTERIYLFILCLLSLFLATFHLKESYLLIHDTARDTLKILTLWQTKSITLIGPPASFSLNTIREFYFGSLSYYLGLIGLLISRFNPIGSTYATTLLFIVSIPFIYLFLKNLNRSSVIASVGTLLYVVSPLTVTHLRFFWNPNTIIPLSIFYWYLVTHQKQSLKKNFLSGLLAGIIFNLHYFAVFPMLVWQLILIVSKKHKYATSHFLGFIIASLPLIFFELKHQFYLTNAFFYNLSQSNNITTFNPLTYIGSFGEFFMALLGIKSAEIIYPTLLNLIPHNDKFYARYLFGCYPLAIWLLAKIFNTHKLRPLLILVTIFVLYSDIKILSYTPSLATGYLPLSTLERVSRQIVTENIQGKYNLSENIFGDAQALGLRYFVQRDAINKPLDPLSYRNLDQLYVLSPSLNKIISDNRWEFYASGPWKLSSLTPYSEVSLYRFSR